MINIVGVEFLINFGGLGQLINELAERYDLPGTYGAILFVILVSIVFFDLHRTSRAMAATGQVTTCGEHAAARGRFADRDRRNVACGVGSVGGVGMALPRCRAVAGAIGAAILRLLANPDFYANLGVTAAEIGVALAIGGVTGLATGILLGANRFLSDAFESFLLYLGPTPKIIFFPVMIMWFGVGRGIENRDGRDLVLLSRLRSARRQECARSIGC